MVLKFNLIDLRFTHEIDDNADNTDDTNDTDDNDDDDDNEPLEEKFVIHAFGRTASHKSVFCKIVGYTPNFFIKIPTHRNIQWHQHHVDHFVKMLKLKIDPEYRNGLIHYDVVTKHDFYGFTAGATFNFIRLIFCNHVAFNKYRYACNRKLELPLFGYRKVELYEANVDPLIRCMHVMNVDPAGWVKIHKNDYTRIIDEEQKQSECDIEIVVHWTKVENANIESIARLIVCAFDIECNSIDGSFPQATRPGDKIIQIGSTFSYYGESECFYKNIITLKTCTGIEGADVEQYEDERDVLLAWTRLLKRLQPDILTGYNIFGFDFKYIYERYETIYCPSAFLQMSKLKNFQCELKTKNLSSSAYGVNEFKYLDIPGMVMIDLFKVIQREYNLNSYKLDNVISHFINEPLTLQSSNNDDESSDEHTIRTTFSTTSTDGLYKGNYFGIMICDELGEEMYENGKKFKITELTNTTITIDDEVLLEDGCKHKWCLVKDDVKPHEIFALQKGTADDRKKIAEYCLQDCAHCNRLMNKLDVITNNVSMANVSCVPFEMIFMRGQGIKLFSLVLRKCRLKNHLIPVLEYNENVDNWYEGARVLNPMIGCYMEEAVVSDAASLYPSSMCEGNLSQEMIVLDPKYDNHPDYTYYDVEYEEIDGTITHNRFAKHKDGTLAIIPEALTDLLSARKNAKKMMKQEKDPFKKALWNSKQLAFKVTANSLYGQIGAATSPIYMKAIAASTTAIGRKRLDHAKVTVENNYPNARIIYGDTDSIFINFGIKATNPNIGKTELLTEAIRLGKEATEMINAELPWPQAFEYEKTFYPFILLSKKRYVGNKYEEDPTSFKQTSMGIVLKRRDNAKIVKYVYNGLIDIILNKQDVSEILDFVKSTLQNILDGNFPMKYFEVTKTLGANYKDRSSIAHAVLADRMAERDPGNKPQINDRIPYVAIITKPKKGQKVLQGDRIEHPDYIVENNEKIDYLFYIEKQIKNPCIQLLDLVTDQASEVFNRIIINEKSRRDGLVPLTQFFGKKQAATYSVSNTCKKHHISTHYASPSTIPDATPSSKNAPTPPITNWFKQLNSA